MRFHRKRRHFECYLVSFTVPRQASGTVADFGAVHVSDYERGFDQFRQMVGDERIDALITRFKAVCPDFGTEVVSVVGGRFWTRTAIDLKTRSLCSIAILAALGRQNALRLNFEMAVNNGASLDEICESLMQVAVYAGFPAAWDALVTLESVLDEIRPDTRTV